MLRHTAMKPRLCAAAEEAYTECIVTDKKVALLREAASTGGAKSGVEDALASFKVDVPEMPRTEAVLRTLPPAGDFPGAQFRLAGDRCGVACFRNLDGIETATMTYHAQLHGRVRESPEARRRVC